MEESCNMNKALNYPCLSTICLISKELTFESLDVRIDWDQAVFCNVSSAAGLRTFGPGCMIVGLS